MANVKYILFQLVRMSDKFCVNSVPIGMKFNAAGVPNGAKRHLAWL